MFCNSTLIFEVVNKLGFLIFVNRIIFITQTLNITKTHNYIIKYKMSYMTEKKYKGTLYGMRMETNKDREIKRVLTKLSERKNIPVNRLIFAYLEKALNINGKQEINIKEEELNEDFKGFFDKITKRILSLENNVKMQFFEKRDTLKNYIYNKYPDDIQKKIFFLKLIKTQIYCEEELLHELFFLCDYKSNESIGYARFLCESNNISFTSDNYNKKFNECLIDLYLRWFYELKTAGIIKDLNDFKKIEKIKDFDNNLNYLALEDFIFNDLYKTGKALPSSKEKRIKLFEKNPKSQAKNKIFSLSYRLRNLFRELVKYNNGYSNEILHFEENEYQLFSKIGYNPHIFNESLDLNGYADFIKKHDLMRSLSDSLVNRTFLFKQLNKDYTFPPLTLITKISLFFSYLKEINIFLEKLPESINCYSDLDLLKIGAYLYKLSENQSDNRSTCKTLLNKIPNKNIDCLNEIMPKKYEASLQFIRTQLKKKGRDLDSFLANVSDETNRRIKDDRMMYENAYPEDVKNKRNETLKNYKKINADLIKN